MQYHVMLNGVMAIITCTYHPQGVNSLQFCRYMIKVDWHQALLRPQHPHTAALLTTAAQKAPVSRHLETHCGGEEALSSWWPSLGLLPWCLNFKSSHCGSFEDRAYVGFLSVCPMLHLVTKTWLHCYRGIGMIAPAMTAMWEAASSLVYLEFIK